MLIKWNVTIPKLSGNNPRKAYVWLPDDYEANPEKRYGVLYMFDGHNIFRDEYAAFGKSWGMEAYLQTKTSIPVLYGSHAPWLSLDTPDEICAPNYASLCYRKAQP